MSKPSIGLDAAVGARPRRIDEILAVVRGLERAKHVSELTRLLGPAR